MTKIYGEETVEIPIFNGVDPGQGMTSDKYCRRLINFIQSDEGYEIRDDYLLLQEVAAAVNAIPITLPIPLNVGAPAIEAFQCSGSQTVDSPSFLFCRDDGATRDINWINCNTTVPTNVTQTMSVANRGVKAFCQYRDRYYASNFTSQVFRMSNFVTGGPTITVTDLFAQAGINILVTYKNRIFGMAKNRIYYTDLPAIGGYPETWNAVTNFVDLPSTDYDVTIYNALVYKDKLYLFTDRGLFYLVANGDPTNWSIQLVSATFSIFNRDSVCINKNFIFLTNQYGIYAFNGVKFDDITGSIKGAWDRADPTTYFMARLYPYEEGILLDFSTMNTSGGNYVGFGGFRYYFNFKIWVEIDPNGGSSNIVSSILKAGVGLLPFRGRPPTSWIAYKHNAPAFGNLWRVAIVDKGRWAGDCWSTNWATATTKKDFYLDGPSFLQNEHSRIRLKYYEIFIYFNEGDADPAKSAFSVVGSDPPSGTVGVGLVATDSLGDFLARLRIPFSYQPGFNDGKDNSFRTNNVSISIIGHSHYYNSLGGHGHPPIVIKKITAIINRDNMGSDVKFTR